LRLQGNQNNEKAAVISSADFSANLTKEAYY
jgi:hypothetical protein